jgi:hypothetical protein
MRTEPVITIGAVITSIQAAVVALLTVAVLAADLDAEQGLGFAIIGAGSAVTLAVGNALSWYLTRRRVSPVSPLDRLDG